MRDFMRRYWIIPLSMVLGIYIGLPFMAPVFMHFGLTGEAKIIYHIYSFMCHQLPERSYFLFGSKLTYSLLEIQNAWKITINPAVLRQFIGNSQMGWKVAWSDRMISMYGGLFIFGILWWPFNHRIKPLPWWALLLFLLPMAIDGSSHFVSDLAGIGQGFRANNLWLVALTRGSLPASFYAGDAWGSFNSLMRLISGLLFGMGIVWFGYPYIDLVLLPQDKPSKAILTSQPINLHDNIHL
jgi:uncharacterized membrane protein